MAIVKKYRLLLAVIPVMFLTVSCNPVFNDSSQEGQSSSGTGTSESSGSSDSSSSEHTHSYGGEWHYDDENH